MQTQTQTQLQDKSERYSLIQSTPRTSDNYQFDYTVGNISESRPIRLITESIRAVSILKHAT